MAEEEEQEEQEEDKNKRIRPRERARGQKYCQIVLACGGSGGWKKSIEYKMSKSLQVKY